MREGIIFSAVISHIHSDHAGGLKAFLERNSNVTVYIPKSFSQSYKDMIKEKGAEINEVQGSCEIFNGVFSTGQLGEFIKEQSLIIKTEKGAIIITGCAHPGIVRIIEEAKKIINDKIFLVIGGFHLSGETEEKLKKIVSDFKRLHVQYVGPCHCSGDGARKLFEESYGQNYIKVGVGKVIRTKELR